MRIKPTMETLSKVKSKKLKKRPDPLMTFVQEHNRSLLVKLSHAKLKHQVEKYLTKKEVVPIIRNLRDLASLAGSDRTNYSMDTGSDKTIRTSRLARSVRSARESISSRGGKRSLGSMRLASQRRAVGPMDAYAR